MPNSSKKYRYRYLHAEIVGAELVALEVAGVDEGGAVEAEDVQLVQHQQLEPEALPPQERLHVRREDLQKRRSDLDHSKELRSDRIV